MRYLKQKMIYWPVTALGKDHPRHYGTDWIKVKQPLPNMKKESNVTNKPEGTPNDGTWPEQNEVNAWFENHSFELKDRVSKYRIEIQKQLD